MADIKKYLDTTALGALVDQIKAEDAKVLDAAKKYTDDAGSAYDVAGAAATAESNAKAYTDELANGQVATNKADIEKLNGDSSTEGSVAKAVADAKATIDADVDAVEAKADKNAEDIAAINNAESGILAQAKAFATAEDAKVQANIDAVAEDLAKLDIYVGDIPEGYTETNVIAYINKKAQETLDSASGGSSESAASVLAALNTYKSENDPKVNKNIEDIAALQTALDEEVERADAAEKANAAAIKAISDDYLKESDKTELQGNIDTVSTAVERLTNGVSADEVDGVNDLIEYVKEHGSEVTGMQEDISDNADAIAGVAGRMDTAEGKISTLEGAVATKAEKTYVDEAVEALESADSTLSGRLDAIEAQLGDGEGSVADQIADAQAAAEATAAADATAKANAALADAKAYTDTKVGEDRVRLDALEAIEHHDHSNKAELDLIASGDKAKWDAASEKAHEHTNSAELAKIADGDVAKWNAAEQNAKTFAQGLNDTMQGVVDGIGSRVGTLETTIVDKADSDDLDAAVERITKNETDIASLTSSVNSFTPITAEEVYALFA